jgi:enoyl-CoA hydratase/carnithine racemase
VATVKVEHRDDDVVVITLDNPPVNALTTPVFEELGSIARDLTRHPPGAVVLTGQPNVFAWGGEISEVRRLRFGGPSPPDPRNVDAALDETMDAGYVAELGHHYQEVFEGVAAIPRMVISALEGVAFGGGLELALCCDYRIASEAAIFASPEVTLGISTIGSGPFRMPRLIGYSQTKRLMLAGGKIDAAEALRIGRAALWHERSTSPCHSREWRVRRRACSSR